MFLKKDQNSSCRPPRVLGRVLGFEGGHVVVCIKIKWLQGLDGETIDCAVNNDCLAGDIMRLDIL